MAQTLTQAIRVQMVMDTDGVRKGMNKATGAVRVGTKNMVGRFNVLKGSIIGVAGAIGGLIVAQRAASFFFNVNREAQKLQASLKTVTGSADLAAKAFAGIEKFAAETPFQVEQVADAFIKLQALGLNPSERALRSYGNTASAMGKDLNQFIEAVADASTMEFERLKEFGIKARQQGEEVSFTFQGVTTTVGKNAEEINEFLTSIGENQFAGAMQEQTETMDGVISNILDNISSIARTLGAEGGLNELITDMLKTFRDLTKELAANKEAIKNWGLALTESLKAAGNFLKVAKNALEIWLALNGNMRLSVDDILELDEGLKGLQGNVQKAGNHIKAAVEATRNWTVPVEDLQITLDEVATQLEQKVKPAIPIPEAIELHNEFEGTHLTLQKVESAMVGAAESAASIAASFVSGNRSLKSMLANIIKIGAQTAATSFIPGAGGGIVSSFLGGLFKSGSAGPIKSGPVKMARAGMEIGNIGAKTQIIGVHKNEGVANERFMDNFAKRFGSGAFAHANATGELPGGDVYNITVNGGNMNQADAERMFIAAHRSAKRKLLI